MGLFDTKTPSTPAPASDVKIDIVEEGLVRIRFIGEVDGALVKQFIVRMREAMGTRRARFFLADCTSVTGVDTTMRGPSVEALRLLKSHGITGGFVAAASPLVRMVVSTLGIASGLRLELLATPELALERARKSLKDVKA